jgi:hypothetical protein
MGGRGARLAVPNSYPIYGPDRVPRESVTLTSPPTGVAPPPPDEPDEVEPTEVEPDEVPEPEADES